MNTELKRATKAYKSATEARTQLQAKLEALEIGIENAGDVRSQLRAAEKARKAELGAARLDSRTADTAALDKRIRALRANVEALEADEFRHRGFAGAHRSCKDC